MCATRVECKRVEECERESLHGHVESTGSHELCRKRDVNSSSSTLLRLLLSSKNWQMPVH